MLRRFLAVLGSGAGKSADDFISPRQTTVRRHGEFGGSTREAGEAGSLPEKDAWGGCSQSGGLMVVDFDPGAGPGWSERWIPKNTSGSGLSLGDRALLSFGNGFLRLRSIPPTRRGRSLKLGVKIHVVRLEQPPQPRA